MCYIYKATGYHLPRPWLLCFLTCFISNDLHINSIIPLPWLHPTQLSFTQNCWNSKIVQYSPQWPQNSVLPHTGVWRPLLLNSSLFASLGSTHLYFSCSFWISSCQQLSWYSCNSFLHHCSIFHTWKNTNPRAIPLTTFLELTQGCSAVRETLKNNQMLPTLNSWFTNFSQVLKLLRNPCFILLVHSLSFSILAISNL